MKFRFKITICMICLLAILFGVGGSLLIGLSFQDSLDREQNAVYNDYQMVISTLQIVNGVNQQLEYADISDMLKQLSIQNRGSWTAMRMYNDELSVYEDGNFPDIALNTASASNQCTIQYRILSPSQKNGESKDSNGKNILVVSGLLEAGKESFHLEIVKDISSLFETRAAWHQVYQGVFFLLMILCALFSYGLSGVLTRPLSELSRASKAIAKGDFSRRIPIRSKDEIGRVARDFNAMAGSMENNISELKASMERQERFLGSFAHEMKTPMTSIIGYADLIRGQTLDGKEQSEAANYIVTEGRRLERLSQKLLELLVVKQEDFACVRVSPASVIYGLAEHLSRIYRADGIVLTCACEEGQCLMEPDLIKSLLVNLWDNAAKALEGKGGQISVSCSMTGKGCRITVSDNGRGIPHESLVHLTEAFYRVDKSRSRKQGGAGLGLALCSEIAAIHQGSLQFESEEEKGTTVTVELCRGR